MKEKTWRYKYIVLTLLLFFLANLFAVSRLLLLKGDTDRIALCFPGGTLPASAWEQLSGSNESREEEGNMTFAQAALWKSLNEVTVSADQTGRSQKVSGYRIKGHPAAVFGKGLLRGRYFTEEEENVCLLDQGTVRKLFGSEQVLELKVQVGGTDCRIIGILDGTRPVCVVPPGDGDGFDGAAVRKKKRGQSSSLSFSRIEAAAGSVGGQRIDGQLYYVTACGIYFGVLALSFLLTGIGLGRKMHRKWVTAICFAAAAGLLWLGFRCAAPGSDYLPAYWSDFDFFVRIFQEKVKQIGELTVHQEFFEWQNLFRAWQQVIGAGIFISALSLCAASFLGNS